jgi:hypothetical protein
VITQIVSGAQTGVDRAALDVALELGIDVGGWMPRGFLAEDGKHPDFAEKYGMEAMTVSSYPARTRMNVEIADAVLILVDDPEQNTGGTRLTENIARELNKRWAMTYLRPVSVEYARGWIKECGDGILMVAGPRESKSPGIYERAKAFLLAVLRE